MKLDPRQVLSQTGPFLDCFVKSGNSIITARILLHPLQYQLLHEVHSSMSINRFQSSNGRSFSICFGLFASLFVNSMLFAAEKPEEKDKSKDKAKPENVHIEHEKKQIEGWTIHVDKSLLAGEHKELGDKALKITANCLYKISLIVPADKLEKLRKVPIYMDRDHKLGAMQYHPGAGWLKGNGYDVAMTKAVHVPKVRGMIGNIERNVQPYVYLHELAHAYHDREVGFEYPAIRETWEKVDKSGIYDKVLHIRGGKTKHYARTNHKEYFAEMTECFFGTNDFYPFVKSELKEYDPETYRMLEGVWGKKK